MFIVLYIICIAEKGRRMKVIVGLGNPGMEYARTKHNVGFDIVTAFAKLHSVTFNKRNPKALVGETNINGEKIVLVKPMTYMNLSGEAVAPILKKYNASADDLLIIYDDLDLDVGRIRVKEQGSAGGHNGMKSVINCCHTNQIARMRIGIGRSGEAIDYVLSKFSKKDRIIINETYVRATDAITDYLEHGIAYVMNNYNSI